MFWRPSWLTRPLSDATAQFQSADAYSAPESCEGAVGGGNGEG